MREHAQYKNNRINEYLHRRNVNIQQHFSVYSTISLALINSLEMCNLHCVISLASMENDTARETTQNINIVDSCDVCWSIN